MAENLLSPIGPMGEAARELLVRALGPGADQIGEMIANELKVFKAARIARLAEKWREKWAGRNIPDEAVQSLPFGSLYRVLQAASTEDDDEVLDLWAGLLANAMDPSSDVSVQKVYEDILSKIGATEVLLLQIAHVASQPTHIVANDASSRALIERLSSILPMTRSVAYENLRRLGCVLPVDAYRQFGFSMPRSIGTRDNAASAQGVAAALDLVIKLQRLSSGATKYDPVDVTPGYPMITVSFELTQLGKNLLSACTSTPSEEKKR